MIDTNYNATGIRTAAELNAASAGANKELGKNEFLKLMIAQLEHQDPLSPQDGGEFVAQLAQFSSVEGIEKLNESVSGAVSSFQSSQALQATSMIGRSVRIESNAALLDSSGSISGSYDLPSNSQKVEIEISNSSGELVRKINVPPQLRGTFSFEWDGLTDDGSVAGQGNYQIDVHASIAGENYELRTYMDGNVDSVTMQGNTLALNVGGIGTVSVDQVREIK